MLSVVLVATAVGLGFVFRDRMSAWASSAIRSAGLFLAVAVLALQVTFHGWLTGADHVVTEWFVAHRNPTLDHVALLVTNGFGPVFTAVAAAVAAVVVAWRYRSILCGLTVVVTIGGASLLCTGIKLFVGRLRPPIAIQETLETDYSFPSGHVTGTTALVGMIAVIIGFGGSRLVQWLLATAAALVITAVAVSRLYLGVHWLTDVVAGVLLGAAAVTLGGQTIRALTSENRSPANDSATFDNDHKALV